MIIVLFSKARALQVILYLHGLYYVPDTGRGPASTRMYREHILPREFMLHTQTFSQRAS